MPQILHFAGNSNRAQQKAPVSDGSNSFLMDALVYIASGVLAAVPTDGVLVYGQTMDASHAPTDQVPAAMFGEQHYPIDIRDCILVVAVTNDAGTFSDSGPTWTGASMAVGNKYGILTPTSGANAGMQFLTVDETTAVMFEVVGLHPSCTVTTPNPRVLVKIPDTKIQLL